MGFSINKKGILQEDITVTTAEQPISCDVLLPDYYPDISRILSCRVGGQTTSVQSRGDKLNIDGIATIEVIYQNEEQGVHGTTYKVPFSKIIQLKSENPRIEVEIKPATPICKALSRRRIDVGTTLTIVARITAVQEVPIVCDAEGMGIQLRTDNFTNLKKLPLASKTVSLSEKIPLPESLQTPIQVVTTRGLPVITEIKPAGTRVIVKGNLDLWILVWGQNDKKATVLRHSQSWTSLLENADNDDIIYEGIVKLLSAETTYGGEYDPDDNNLTVNSQLEVTLQGYEEEEYTAIQDAYSREFGTDEVYKDVTLRSSGGVISDNWTEEERFHLPDGVTDIMLIEFSPEFSTYRINDSQLELTLRGTLSVMAKMSDGGFECFERQWDMNHSMPIKECASELEFTPSFNADSLKWSIDGDMLTVSAQVQLTGTPLWCQKRAILTALTLLEEQPKDIAASSGLLIYYAQAGESLWDIAKRYNSSIDLISELNDLKEEIIIKSTPIIIPRV